MIPKNSLISLLLLAVLSPQNTPLGAAQILSREVEQIRARYLTANCTVVRPIADLMRQTGYRKKGPITLDAAVDWTQKKWRDQWYKPNSDQRVVAEKQEQGFDHCMRELKLLGTNISLPEAKADEPFTVVLFHSDIYLLATQKLSALRALIEKASIPHLVFATDNSEAHKDIVRRAPKKLYRAILRHLKPDVTLDNFEKPTTKDEVFNLVWKKLELEKAFPNMTVHRTEGNKLTEFLQQNPGLPRRLLLASGGHVYAGDALALHKRLSKTEFQLTGGAWANASPEALAIFKEHAEREITDQDQRRFELNTLARTLWWIQQTQGT